MYLTRELLTLGTVLLTLGAMLAINNATADSAVWQVSSGSNTVFIGGTVHLLRPSDYPLPEEYEQAYQTSSEIYLETDLTAMADISVQRQILQQLTYQDDRTLESVLSDEAYDALSEYVATSGMPMMMFEKLFSDINNPSNLTFSTLLVFKFFTLILAFEISRFSAFS